jgi:hypothetical protein
VWVETLNMSLDAAVLPRGVITCVLR